MWWKNDILGHPITERGPWIRAVVVAEHDPNKVTKSFPGKKHKDGRITNQQILIKADHIQLVGVWLLCVRPMASLPAPQPDMIGRSPEIWDSDYLQSIGNLKPIDLRNWQRGAAERLMRTCDLVDVVDDIKSCPGQARHGTASFHTRLPRHREGRGAGADTSNRTG